MTYAAYVDDDDIIEHATAVARLTTDLAIAGRTMGPKEARFLVDAYYISQESRKRLANQLRSFDTGVEVDGEVRPEPHVLIDWLFTQSKTLENQIKRALDQYTQGHIMGSYLRGIVGIGPVISAGLLAHLERPRTTAGQIYAFAGLAADGQKKWEKGEKRPYNAQLKTLCWHAGNSFMKLSNRDDCFYGKLYRERKAFEQRMSDEGKRAETAAEWLPRVGKTTQAYGHYAKGRLPPSQIDGRARRYAVKLFLAAFQVVWYFKEFGELPPLPYPIAHLGHTHVIYPPGYENVPGLLAAFESSKGWSVQRMPGASLAQRQSRASQKHSEEDTK